MTAYYNEIDPYAAQWLRNLIDAGHIAPGNVDERSIVDVRADDLRGYTQCHWFGGIGGWSLALRLAGWPDDRPVWTGSCPCQPFSAAGKGKASDDKRHLWPAWFSLIAECHPPIVFGEQVEAAVGWGWVDAVFADLEGEGYACGTTVLPACGIGAPHIRQRLWFMADAMHGRTGPESRRGDREEGSAVRYDGGSPWAGPDARIRGSLGILADRIGSGLERRDARPLGYECAPSEQGGTAGELVDANGARSLTWNKPATPLGYRRPAVATMWADCDWLPCRDGKARPVEPGTFPLAHGIPARVGKLRAYGNAIVPQVAAEFIAATLTLQ